MRRFSLLLFILVLCGCGRQQVDSISIKVRHLEHLEFLEEHTVKPGEEFYISDTDYSARAAKVVSDFTIDTKTRKVTSRSKKWNNPAVLMRVYFKGKFLYEAWVLQKATTVHYVKKPGFYFEIKEIKFKEGEKGIK